MIRGVIFDVGGVLAYDVWEHLLCDPSGDPLSVSAKYQIPASQLEKIGATLWSKFDRVKGDPTTLENGYWQQFLSLAQGYPALSSVPVGDLVTLSEVFIRPVNKEDTTQLLEWLVTKGVHLGICSNNNEFWFLRQMQQLGLYRFFSPKRIILSCHYGITKSDYRLFHIAADALGLHPTECVFVDDRMGNVSRSIDCGMTGVLFPTEQFPAKAQRGAQYLRRLLAEILK
jgi:FMN phosphatase YigB (HAD superfamily)